MGWAPLGLCEAVLGGARALWIVWGESTVLLAQTRALCSGINPDLRRGHCTLPIQWLLARELNWRDVINPD